MLADGDRRSIGRVGEVVDLVRVQPERMGELMECLWDADAGVRMRAAGAIEKLSREQAVLVRPYKAALLSLLAEVTQQDVRWHLAAIVPRLPLSVAECRRVAEALETFLEDRSSIVKTCAMQGLFDLIDQDGSMRPGVYELLQALARSGTPAMRARGRILLGRLGA